MKQCLLDEHKECNECLECDRCDLDPDKLCDNCCKCIDDAGEAFLRVPIADVVTEDTQEYLAAYYEEETAEESDDL